MKIMNIQKPTIRNYKFFCAFMVAMNIALIGALAHWGAPKVATQIDTSVQEICHSKKKSLLGISTLLGGECTKLIHSTSGYQNVKKVLYYTHKSGLPTVYVGLLFALGFGLIALPLGRK